MLQIDLALTLLRLRQDLPRVQALLDQARSHAISDTLEFYHAMAAGMLAVERGEAAKAVPLLERASQGFSALRHADPGAGVRVDVTRAYLALAHVALGNWAEAERPYRLAKPRLWALKRNDLRRRCEEVLGLTAGG